MAIAILRDRRISDRRARFFRAVLIRPLPPVTDYRPKPDPRRTRRQRFIELFDPDIDRSDEPARRYGSVGPVVAIAGLVGGILFDAVVFSLPLLSIWWIYPGAIGLCIIGVVWIWLGAAGGIRMELDAREKGTGAQVSA